MSKQTRNTLKSFFQTGDVPTEGQYVDLIDSNLNLSENNTGDIQLTGDITASGNISASNTSGTHILGGDLTVGDDLFVTDDIHLGGTNSAHKILQRDSDGNLKIGNDSSLQTGAGNTEIEGLNSITASSDEIKIEATSGPLNLVGNVTASGNLLASGNINTNQISGSKILASEQISSSGFISTETSVTASIVSASNSLVVGDITSSGKIRMGGRVTSSVFDIACVGSIDTDGEMSCTGFSNSSTTSLGGRVDISGASSYVQTPSYISSSRVFTEHVSASGNISASGLTLTKEEKGGIGNYGVDGGLTANGQSTKFQITGIPTIPGRASNKVSKPQPTFIKNNVVKEDSVILVTCTTDELSAVGFGNNTPTAIANKGFFINIGNEAALDFTVTSASFSAVII